MFNVRKKDFIARLLDWDCEPDSSAYASVEEAGQLVGL